MSKNSNHPAMAGRTSAPILRDRSGADTSPTRRDFCLMSVLLPLGTVLACRSTSSLTVSEDAQIETAAHTFAQLAEREPKLPGVLSVFQLRDDLSHITVTPEDAELLTGALYLEAERVLRTGVAPRTAASQGPTAERPQQRPITASDVRTALARPIDISPYNQEYIANLLQDTKRRLASDPRFREELNQAQAAAARKTCLGGTPRWICIGMIVVVVVGTILLFI